MIRCDKPEELAGNQKMLPKVQEIANEISIVYFWM